MALARRKAVSSAAWRLRVNLSLVFGLCLVDRDVMSFSFGLDELAFFRRLFSLLESVSIDVASSIIFDFFGKKTLSVLFPLTSSNKRTASSVRWNL